MDLFMCLQNTSRKGMQWQISQSNVRVGQTADEWLAVGKNTDPWLAVWKTYNQWLAVGGNADLRLIINY